MEIVKPKGLTREDLAPLLPAACAWAEEQEARILREGIPLDSEELEDAKRLGVAKPGAVRLLRVAKVPRPDDPTLRAAADSAGMISANTAGLCLRYGIFVRADHWGSRRLVAHELVHTCQYERIGGFRGFLERYLGECITIGYPNGPLEQEAIRRAREL